MGIVLSAVITTTCSELLLWFVMLLMLPHTLTAMLDIHMPTPHSPDTAPPTELTPYESTDSPPLLSQLLPEDMPLPEDTSPTLPESSMLPRERLRLMPMLMLSTDTTDMPDLMLTVLETEAKADAALLYGAYGYGPGYAGYSAYGAYPYAYGAYPYAYGAYYGKRSADAEPEADADAYYGYYGYARPYAYGLGYARYGYGYPYGYGYAWGK